MERLTAIMDRYAHRIFWCFFILHVLVWTCIPALVQQNAPLDVVEGFAWGREWLLGTHKHPPLQAWLLESAGTIFGSSGFGFFGLSALFGALAYWAVFRTGLLFTGKATSLYAALSCTGILYFNLLTPEFNPNVLQLTLWAWAAHYFAKACLKGNLRSWIKLGLLGGIGLYAKFSTALLLFGFVLFFLAHKTTRAQLKRPGPYAAALLCIGLFIPEWLWLQSHDFLPLAYAKSRAVHAENLLQTFIFPLKFVLSQLGACALALLLCLPFLRKSIRASENQLGNGLLFWLAFAPLLLCVCLSLLTAQKFKDMWGMPFLSFIPLWLLSLQHTSFTDKQVKAFLTGAVFLFVLTPVLFVANYFYATELGYKPLRGHFPGQALSRHLLEKWREATPQPLAYVVGDTWLAGNIALYAPLFAQRPHVVIEGNMAINPTFDTEDLVKKGMLVVWKGDTPPALPERFGAMPESYTVELPWAVYTGSDVVVVHWAIVKPTDK